MRKSIILLAMVLGAFTANAQTVVEGTKFADNWSVEVRMHVPVSESESPNN